MSALKKEPLNLDSQRRSPCMFAWSWNRGEGWGEPSVSGTTYRRELSASLCHRGIACHVRQVQRCIRCRCPRAWTREELQHVYLTLICFAFVKSSVNIYDGCYCSSLRVFKMNYWYLALIDRREIELHFLFSFYSRLSWIKKQNSKIILLSCLIIY